MLEFVPETVYRIAKHYTKMNQRMPLLYVKLYTYQVRRGAVQQGAVSRLERPMAMRESVCAKEMQQQRIE